MSHRDPATSLDALLVHRAWVRALARTLVADEHAAEDLEQQTWLAAVRRPPLRWSTPRAWLGTVLRRTASKMRRMEARHSARIGRVARREARSSAADLAAQAEIHEQVVHAVLALPEPYRSVVLFRYFEGLAPREIARRTGTPVNTVRSQVQRGVERLREHFDLEHGAAWQATLLSLVYSQGKATARGGLTAGGVVMATHSKCLLLVAAVLVLTASFVTWAVVRGGGAPERAPRNDTLGATESGPAPVERGARRAAPAEDEVLVFGRVRLPDGAEVSPASFWAAGDVKGARRLLEARTEMQEDAYRTSVSFLGATVPWAIDFGVAGHGFVGHVERLQVTAGRAYRVDFTLESAPVLSARVEDGSGRPVRGLEILVRPLPRPPWGLTSGGMLDTEQLRLDGTGHFAHGRTDPDGRIALRALGPGTYGVFCAREEWILEHERVLRPGDGEARVTAWPAHAVVGTVRDAATDDPVDRAHVTVVLRTGAGHAWTKSGTVTRGRLWLAWKPAAEETEHGFEAAVSVAAPGYLTRKKLILFPRGTRRRQVSFQLETPPARGFASVLLEVVDSWGKPVDLALLFRTDPASGLAVTPEGPGLYRLRAPPGKRTLRVAPRLRLGRTLEWTGSPEWREGHEALVRCELPAFGIVRVRRPASAGEKKPWLVAADADDGNGGGVFQIEEDEVRFAVVAGLWHFGPEGARRTVTVRPGAEVDVTLGG